MNFPELTERTEKLNALRADLKSIFDEARNDAGELDASKLKSVKLPDGVALKEYVDTKSKEMESLHNEVEDLKKIQAMANFALSDPDSPATEASDRRPGRESFGEAFVNSIAYTGRNGAQGPTATLDIDIRGALFERGDGWAPESTRTGHVDLAPTGPLSVLDFIPQHPTDQSAVKFMREVVFNASAVVEKAEGAAFGEAEMELAEVTKPVEKVPAFIPVTDEQLEDVAGARSYLDSRLVYMVRRRVDRQILGGTGVTPLLEGTTSLSGLQTQAKGGDTIPDALYKLFVKIWSDIDTGGGDADPSAVFIRAAHWQEVQLERTADGVYIWGHPSQVGPRTIWGVPVVQTNAAPADTAVTGDYAVHSYLAVKRGVDVQISNSHADFFASGKQALRADVRLAMVHLRPSAFGELTGL